MGVRPWILRTRQLECPSKANYSSLEVIDQTMSVSKRKFSEENEEQKGP